MTRLARFTLTLAAATLGAAGCATTAEPTRAPKPNDLEAMKAIGAKVSGTILWVSARAGLPHIFSMRTDGTEIKQLTKGDFTDTQPRLSPDGTKILFSRGREEGLTRENHGSDEAWDLYIVGADGKGIGREVERATWGTWVSNDEIVYQRGAKILRSKVGGDEETLVLDTSGIPELAGAVVEQPALSPSGNLVALSLAGARPRVGIWHLKKKYWSPVGAGSQIAWAADGKSVLWVSNLGKGSGEIARVAVEHGEPVVPKTGAEPEAEKADEQAEAGEGEAQSAATGEAKPTFDPKDPTRLLDLQGKRSHEFFPRLSADGKWLAFGAARAGGPLDVEDFEIYLWEVGTPPGDAVRLTFDAGNDRWPDLFAGGAAGGGEADDAPKKEAAPETAPAEAPKTEETPAEKTESPEGATGDAAAPPSEDAPADEGAPNVKAKGKGKVGKKKRR